MAWGKRISRALGLVAGAALTVLCWQVTWGSKTRNRRRALIWRAATTCSALYLLHRFVAPHVRLWEVVAGCVAVFGFLLAGPIEPEPDIEETRESLRQLIGPNNGVHLYVCALEWCCAMEDARAVIEEAGVRIRRSIKIEGVVRTGVHRDDVPPPPLSEEGLEEEEGAVTSTSTSTPRSIRHEWGWTFYQPDEVQRHWSIKDPR